MQSKNYSGFSFIGILIVIIIITIIPILISVNNSNEAEKDIIGGSEDSKARARDIERITDIQNLKVSLELYYKNNTEYPSSFSELTTEYINAIPKDPETGRDYFYAYFFSENKIRAYHLGARLENEKNDVLASDADFNSKVSYVNGFSGDDPIYDLQ